MSVVVPNPYANYKHIIVWVVETLSILLYEPNYRIADVCHFLGLNPSAGYSGPS